MSSKRPSGSSGQPPPGGTPPPRNPLQLGAARSPFTLTRLSGPVLSPQRGHQPVTTQTVHIPSGAPAPAVMLARQTQQTFTTSGTTQRYAMNVLNQNVQAPSVPYPQPGQCQQGQPQQGYMTSAGAAQAAADQQAQAQAQSQAQAAAPPTQAMEIDMTSAFTALPPVQPTQGMFQYMPQSMIPEWNRFQAMLAAQRSAPEMLPISALCEFQARQDQQAMYYQSVMQPPDRVALLEERFRVLSERLLMPPPLAPVQSVPVAQREVCRQHSGTSQEDEGEWCTRQSAKMKAGPQNVKGK